ncbi:MAG: hypothetical protein AB1641_21015 [Thermodesulfobacteriota bacterium]
MNKERIVRKLDKVLDRLGMNTVIWSDTIQCFREKLEILSETNNYSKLLNNLFASNDLNEFNSYVFEVQFAYDFQSNNQTLTYEIATLSHNNSRVDYCYKFNDLTIYIELKLVQQRNEISKSKEVQLAMKSSYQIMLHGNEEFAENIRLQNHILLKCQKEDGTPIKFSKPINNMLNFIAVNVSELHLDMIDEYDCRLTMYGDCSVPPLYRRGVFGMWQDISVTSSNQERIFFEKFRYFRETIHGLLFVRYVRHSGIMSRMFIDRKLEYLLILNRNLLSEKTCSMISEQLGSFLRKWSSFNT